MFYVLSSSCRPHPPRKGWLILFLVLTFLGVLSSPALLPAHGVAPKAPPPAFVRSRTLPRPVLSDAPPADHASARTTHTVNRSLLAAPVATLRERAEDLSKVTVIPSHPVYPIVQSDVVAEGNHAFHLAHPDFTDHIITLNTPIAAASDTRVFFESRLQWAMEDQEARFQISINDGNNWFTLWSRSGDGSAGQSAFERASIELGGFAGQTLLLRFRYAHKGGSAYPQTDTHIGWIIDDIQVGTHFIGRVYDGFGDPTPEEILSVEYINRARADALAEAQRLRATADPDVLNSIQYFEVNLNEMEKQFALLERHTDPLAINAKLTQAARLHSEDMYLNVFQAHESSSNPLAPNQPGDRPSDRIDRQDYNWEIVGENIFAYAKSVWHAHAGFNIDWGDGNFGMQYPPGHREAIHNPEFREIGIGIRLGSNTKGSRTVGPVITTQKFAADPGAGHPFLVGVTYVDNDGDGFYSLGEGLGGVQIIVDGASFMATSSTHGAYAIPLPPDDAAYTVTFSKNGYLTETRQIGVINGRSVKCDYVAQPGYLYTLTYHAGPGGFIWGPKSQSVASGGDGDPVTAVADAGAVFAGWSDGIAEAERRDTNIQNGRTVSARFRSYRGADLEWYDTRGFRPSGNQTWSDLDDLPIPSKGTTLFEEFVADTDPNDPSDIFECRTVDGGGPNHNGIAVSFRSSTNRLYTLQALEELGDVYWCDVPGAGPRPGTGGQAPDYLVDPHHPPMGRFYRVRVTLP